MTIPPTKILAKARVSTQANGKANTWTLSKQNNLSLLKQPQPCRILREELSCISSVDPWITGITMNSVSSVRRQAGAEYLLLDSGAQLRPISYPGQKIPLPGRGIHTASGARLQHDGGRLVTYKLSRRTNNSSAFSCVCRSETNFVSWPSPLNRGSGVIFVQTLVHCSFLTRPRRNEASHSCTRKRVCPLSKGRWLRP